MSKNMGYKRLAIVMLASLVLTACGGAAPAAEDKLLVGISMPTKSSTRWISDGESMVKEFEAMGYATDLQFADNDIPNQLAQIENMVTKGAKVLIVAAIDGTTSEIFSGKIEKPGGHGSLEWAITWLGGVEDGFVHSYCNTIPTAEGGLRIGDCVSIERGAFNNIRLEADERCDRPDAGASDAALTRAYACDSAKRQLLEAESDEDFQLAERRMRLLCD